MILPQAIVCSLEGAAILRSLTPPSNRFDLVAMLGGMGERGRSR